MSVHDLKHLFMLGSFDSILSLPCSFYGGAAFLTVLRRAGTYEEASSAISTDDNHFTNLSICAQVQRPKNPLDTAQFAIAIALDTFIGEP